MTETRHRPILEKILEQAHKLARQQPQRHRLLAVFDLDSTLFDLTERVMGILKAFVLDTHNRILFAKECETIKNIQILRADWGLMEPLRRIGITEHTHSEFIKALHEHWELHFFSDRHLHLDQPVAGAVEYVTELHNLGAEILYLTGRDVPRMLPGTEKSLKFWNFPETAPTASKSVSTASTTPAAPTSLSSPRLILKPTAAQDDAHFKLEILKELESKFHKIWLFENEPVNINLVAKHCPNIGMVFIDTTHSGREQISPGTATIEDFVIDLNAIRSRLFSSPNDLKP
jgi:hypothetical protein